MLGMFEVANTSNESAHAYAPVTLADKPLTQKAVAWAIQELEG